MAKISWRWRSNSAGRFPVCDKVCNRSLRVLWLTPNKEHLSHLAQLYVRQCSRGVAFINDDYNIGCLTLQTDRCATMVFPPHTPVMLTRTGSAKTRTKTRINIAVTHHCIFYEIPHGSYNVFRVLVLNRRRIGSNAHSVRSPVTVDKKRWGRATGWGQYFVFIYPYKAWQKNHTYPVLITGQKYYDVTVASICLGRNPQWYFKLFLLHTVTSNNCITRNREGQQHPRLQQRPAVICNVGHLVACVINMLPPALQAPLFHWWQRVTPHSWQKHTKQTVLHFVQGYSEK